MATSHFRISLPLLLISSLLSGCGSGSSGGGGGSVHPVGSVQPRPDGSGTYYIVEAHEGGNANPFRLVRAAWGRLVDIYDQSAPGARALRFKDFVIGREIESGGDYVLERDPLTAVEQLTIVHPFGSAEFENALDLVDINLQPIGDIGLGGGFPLPMVSRNAAMVVQFNDLLDTATVTEDTVRLLVGNPPIEPREARTFIDPNHGDDFDRNGDGDSDFMSTRVILDFTVSAIEQQNSTQPLNINILGLPEALNPDQINALIRIPTVVNVAGGQFQVLRSLGQRALRFTGNGSNDPSVPTFDIVRAFRSGGGGLIPPDPFNGFLPDEIRPQIIGSSEVAVTAVTQSGTEFLLDMTFATVDCAIGPEPGDLVELPGGLGRVVNTVSDPPPGSGDVSGVRVQLLSGSASSFLPGPGVLSSGFEPQEGDLPGCFVTFEPGPLIPPLQGVPPEASILVRFSEPMDPAGFQVFRTFEVRRSTPPNMLEDNVVGTITTNQDLTTYRFVPSTDLTHDLGMAEAYTFAMLTGAGGVTDLAGNTLVNALPELEFELDEDASARSTFGIALRFDNANQDGTAGPEIRGQFTINSEGELVPRPLTRFVALADTENTLVRGMTPLSPTSVTMPLPCNSAQPTKTPLSEFGSHMQTLWRYADLGLGLLNENEMNLDVEGLAWAPFGGSPAVDSFAEFSIRLAHSIHMPDETQIPPPTCASNPFCPLFPTSGMLPTFNNNSLDTPLVVHPRQRGYVINGLNAFIATTGRILLPWPLGPDQEGFQYFTYRDTRTPGVGGELAPVPAPVTCQIDPNANCTVVYNGGSIPSIGLPLLMEFRCFVDDAAVGVNRFQVANVPKTPCKPDFRAHSTGGIDGTGNVVLIDPDNDPVARGGFDPALLGASTPSTDDNFYYGQANFVVRVSTVHTIWFDSMSTSGLSIWEPPVMEPDASQQPTGTEVVVAFRGATALTGSSAALATALTGRSYDFYGNPTPMAVADFDATDTLDVGTFGVTFHQGSNSWKSDISEINGARLVQARLTLISNPVSGLSPRVDALGIAATR